MLQFQNHLQHVRAYPLRLFDTHHLVISRPGPMTVSGRLSGRFLGGVPEARGLHALEHGVRLAKRSVGDGWINVGRGTGGGGGGRFRARWPCVISHVCSRISRSIRGNTHRLGPWGGPLSHGVAFPRTRCSQHPVHRTRLRTTHGY